MSFQNNLPSFSAIKVLSFFTPTSFFGTSTSIFLIALVVFFMRSRACAVEVTPEKSREFAGSYRVLSPWGQKHGDHQIGNLTIGQDGVWTLNLRIGFWGAHLFATTPPEHQKEVLEHYSKDPDTRFQPSATLFKKDSFLKKKSLSLGHNPFIRHAIEEQMKSASRFLSASREEIGIELKVQIEPFFIDETELLSLAKVNNYNSAANFKIYDFFKKGGLPYFPITVLPVPDSNVVTPDFWDIYARPEYLAHEIVHLITRDAHNDGFSFRDFPFDGLTNDGPTFRELSKAGFEPKMDRSLFLAMVNNQPSLFGVFGKQRNAFTGAAEIYKEYMDSDANGKYSSDPETYYKNFEIKRQRFLNSKQPKRRIKQQIPLNHCSKIFGEFYLGSLL